MKILGFIPARGGSKGIPGKNLHPLCERPLIAWTIEAALGSESLDRVVVSSDSDEIITVSKELGAETILRPDALSGDEAPVHHAISHALEKLAKEGYHPDAVAILQPTSPLRTPTHIDKALSMLGQNDCDSVVSLCQIDHTSAPYSAMNLDSGIATPYMEYDEKKNIRQLKPTFFRRNGAIYGFTTSLFQIKGSIFGDRIAGYVMEKEDSFDVDEPVDIFLCECLLNKRLGQ